MSNQESSGGVTRRALLKSTALGSLALAAGGLPALYAAQRRGGSTTGYRRQHPHCLGRLFGQLRQPLRPAARAR
jgi:Tat-targeted selenate reductase subunit YnfE